MDGRFDFSVCAKFGVAGSFGYCTDLESEYCTLPESKVSCVGVAVAVGARKPAVRLVTR